MIQPNKSNKRKSVATSIYDEQFNLLPVEGFELIEIQKTGIDDPIGLISGEEFEAYSKQGVQYFPGVDLQKQLADKQGTIDKIANVAFRGGLGALVAAVEPFAYLVDVENHIQAIKGADRDYSNFLTRGLEGIEDWARETAPIYVEEDEPGILSTDWWFKNTDQIIRSLGYLVPGGALFKGASVLGKGIFGAAARATGKSISGASSAQALNVMSSLGSATLLNYGEHAVSAARHIEENLPTLTQKYVKEGMDPGQAAQQARTILSKQAADIVKGGRVNILWQSISQANLFRGIGHSRRFGILKEGVKGQGLRSGFQKLGIESLTEAAEEVTTGYYESEAQYAANKELGTALPDYRSGYERYAEHLTSYEGITEGLLGGLGAVGMTAGSSVIEKKNNVDALEQIKKTETALGATGERLKDLTKKQVREHALMNALKGTSGNFMEVLETYKNATSEEAKNLGFESNYKELAQEYIEDATFIEDVINNELMNPLRNNQAEAFVLVNHKLNEYYALQDIEKYQNNITDLKAKKEKLFQDIENNVENKELHALRNLAIKRDGIDRAIKGFEANIENIQKEQRPLTKETNETLKGEIKNLADARVKLQETKKELTEKFTDYATLNEKTLEEVREEIESLESAGDLDIGIEINTSLIEAAKIRRKNNISQYQEYVTDPAKLEEEGKRIIKENEEAARAREEERKNKKVSKNTTEEKNAKEKINKATNVLKNNPSATGSQQSSGGAPLTADSPIGEKVSTSSNQLQSSERLQSIDRRVTLNENEDGYTIAHTTTDSEGAPISSEALRVSEAINIAFPNDKFNGNSAKYEINREWGNQVDAIAEAVINGEKLPETPLLNKAVVNKIVARIKRLQKQNPNSTILSQVKIADINSGIAGAMDIVIVREDGSIDVIDIKTSWNSTQDTSYDKLGPNASKKRKHTRQQSAYKYLLEQNGFTVNNISILPFHLNDITSKNTVAGVRNEPIIELSYSQEAVNTIFNSGNKLTSPIFDGDVRNVGDDASDASEQNLENSNQVPDSFNPYFENTGTGKERQLKSSSSLGFRSINWEAYEAEDAEGNPVRRTRSTSNQKTDESKLVESNTALLAGSEVALKLINASNQEITKEELSTMSEEQIDNLAVGVFQNGQKKGALHSLKWIEAKDQFGAYINTADSAVEQELAHSKNIRRTIARGESSEITTSVAFKGHGLIVPLYAENENGSLLLDGNLPIKENKPVSEALPDFGNLDIAITNGGVIYPGEFGLKEETVIPMNQLNYGDGRVVVNLPAPNGKVFPSILFVDNLPEQQAETIIGAAASYQNDEVDTYSTIEENTDIKFGRQGESEALHKFINRYIYSPKVFYKQDVEQEDTLSQNSILVFTPQMKVGESGQSQGLLQIIDLDNRAMYTNDPLFFENNPQFVQENGITAIYDIREEASAQEAIDLLKRKLVSVKRDMINKKDKFVDVILDRTGKVKDVSEHSTYNAFKGQHLKTDINGKNFIEDENGNKEYTYMAQPLISIDTSFANEESLGEEQPDTNVEDNIFLTSPKLEEEEKNAELDERAIDNIKINEITEAMAEELSERFFDYKIIPLKQQLEAVNAFFGVYANAISKRNFKDISTLIKGELQKIVDTKQTRKNKKAAIQHLLDNYDLKPGAVTVEGLVIEKLSKLDILPQKEGFISKDLTDVEIDQMYGEMLEADGFTQEDFVKDIYDFEFYKTNKKRTASSGVKLFLSTISKDKTSWLGGPFKEAIEYQEMYDTLKATLSNVPGTFADQKAAIKKKAEEFNSVVFKKILEKLNNTQQETLRRQFVVAMSGTRLDFVFLKIDALPTGATTRVMEVDRYNTTINVKNKWFRNLMESKLTKVVNINGIQETVIDQKQRKKLQEAYTKRYEAYKKANKLKTPEFVKIVHEYLGNMGINAPLEGLLYLSQKGTRDDINTYLRRNVTWETHVDPTPTRSGFGRGMMSSLFKSFRSDLGPAAEAILNKVYSNTISREEALKQKQAAEIILEAEDKGGFIYGTNPFDGPNYEKVIYGLLNLTLDFEGSVYGDSFRDSKGNLIYPYQNTFGLKRLHDDYITNKKHLSDLLELSYTKNSKWGQALLKDDNYLEIVMFDATNFGGSITNRKEQGKFLQQITLFSLFANQGNEKGYFMPITTADKDIAPAIKVPKLKNVIPNLDVQNGELVDIKGDAIDQIIDYAMDEYNRIMKHKTQPNYRRKSYEEGANYFYMFDYLNAYEGNKDVTTMSSEEATEYIASTVKQNVIAQINSHVSELENLGVDRKFLDASYFRKVIEPQEALLKTKEDKFTAAIADFNLNYIVSNNEVVKLFGNDPAHAYKKSKKENATLKDHIKESINNYEKRKADLISPATTPQYTTSTVTIVTAADSIKDGVESTDAQEYGTIREMLESKLSAGKLPKEVVDRILSAHEAAINDTNNPTNFFKLSDVLSKKEINQYKKIMMADKPVFVQNDIQVEQDSNNKLFRKSSIRYLWPEETTGYGMDNIRVAMENVGIDRLGHESSDKTGAVKVVSIYDENGNVRSLEEVTAALKDGARDLDRLGLGIQQEKGADTGEISYSTQLDVLLFDDMLGKTLSTEESMSDLRDQKEQLQIKFMKFGAKQLFKKLGIATRADGSVYIPNPTTLSEMLKQEAIARKWSARDIAELALKDVDGSIERVFKSPLTFNHARKNIDALVLSLINKELTKIKLPGEALVQAASAGFESNGAISWTEYKAQDKNSTIDNGLILLEGENKLDETIGLQGTRIGKDGKLLPAQILISSVFTDSNGKTVDLSELFTSKDSTTISFKKRYLRLDVLPKELRERILYRIPGQGKPSVSAVEIVGFLPKTSTSSVIVPAALIDQMGSDFDWDTAYTYFKQFDVKQDGTIQIKSKFTELESLQNEYYDLFKKIIFDPVTFKATDKLDNKDLKTAADVVDKILGKESEINSPSYVTTNINNTISQRTGKYLIGPASLAAVMHSALQGKGITINKSSRTNKPIPFVFFEGGKNGEALELTTISAYKGRSYATSVLENAIRTASDNVRTVQNAAVDNANEAVLARAGVNNATIDVALFSLMYKDQKSEDSIHAEQLVYFLRQEAIETYAEKFDYFSAQIEGGFRSEEQIRNDAFNATMADLAEKAGIDPEPDYTANLNEYRTDSDGNFLTFSADNFLKQLQTSNSPNPSYYKTQMAILSGFKQLQNSSDPIRKLQRGIMSPRTKGMGSTIFEAQRTIDNMNEVFNKGLAGVGGLENLEGGQLKEMYIQFDKVYRSLSSILPFNNASHVELINLWQGFTGVKNVSQKTREQLFDAMLNKSYARAFETAFGEEITMARMRLMLSEDHIATRVAELQTTEFGKRNLFISRLIPMFPNKGIPASISYISSKQDDIADRMSIDFVEMYMSPEPGVRELFEDIVKYTYITGGVQSAGNFSKFMPTAYLDKIGFYDALREEERGLTTKNSVSAPSPLETLVEFFQHNPNRTVTLENNEFNKIVTAPIIKVPFEDRNINFEFALSQPKSEAAFDKITYENEDGNRKYLEIISIRGVGSQLELFRKIGTNEDGDVIFRRIGKKGYSVQNYSKINEYGGLNKFTEDGRLMVEYSILPTNNVPLTEGLNIGVPETTSKTPTVLASESIYGFDTLSVTYPTKGRKGVKDLLGAVIENTGNESYKKLASTLLDNIDTNGTALKSINVEESLIINGKNAYGAYNPNNGEITIDLETIVKNQEKLDDTILHEMLHGFVFKEVADKNSKFSKNITRLTKAAKTAFNKAVDAGEIDKNSDQYRELQFAFNNPQEFVTKTMTEPIVQSFLNDVQGSRNLWERFKELVREFLDTLGLDIKKDSLLAESVNTILNHITTSSPSTTKVQNVVKRAAGVMPFDTSISKMQHFIEGNKKVAEGEYTSEEFKNALREYDEKLSSLTSPMLQGQTDTKDEFITVFEERARRLRNKITDKVLKTTRGKQMQDRLNQYEDQIKALKQSKGRAVLNQIMSVQLGFAKRIADTTQTPDPTDVEIKEALNIVDMYNYELVTSQYLAEADRRKDGNVWREMLLSTSKEASATKIRLLDRLYTIAAEQINAGLPEETVTAEDLRVMGEEKWVKSNFLDLSKFKHPLVRTLDSYLKRANRNADSEIDLLFTKIESQMSEVENNSAFKRDPNLFFQRNEKGALTGYFISPYSDKFRQTRNDIFSQYYASVKKAKSEIARNTQATKLLRNLNKIEIAVDVRWLIPGMGQFESDFTSKEDYISYLDSQLGEKRRKELVFTALRQYVGYKQLEDQKMMDIELEVSGSAGDLSVMQEEINTRQETFRERNSPLYHLNYRYGKTRVLNKNKGWKFITTAPVKNAKFYDSRYAAIENDPQLKKFHDFYRSTMKDLLKLLPEGLVSTLPENFFPAAKRGFMEQINSEGIMSIFAGMNSAKGVKNKIGDYLFNIDQEITLDPQFATRGVRDPKTGKLEKNIPVRMLRGKANEKSYDIRKVMQMFGAMSIAYDFKSQVEDKILLLQRLVREAKEIQMDSKGDPMYKKVQRKLKLDTDSDGLKNVQAAVDYAIDSGLYGVSKDTTEEGVVFSKKVSDIKQRFELLKQNKDSGKIDASEYLAEKAKLDEEMKKLGKKPKSKKKPLERLIEYTQLKGLGWNLMSGVNNLSFGTIANYTHAAGKEDFTPLQLMKSYNMCFSKMTKVAKLAEKYGILFEQLDTYYGKRKQKKYNFVQFIDPFMLQEKTEYMNQIAPFIAKMLNTKVANGVTLFDMYDNEGTIKPEYKDLESEWTTKVDAETDNKFTAFRDATIEMNKINHGNYDPNSVLGIKRSVLGRIGTQFRTWAFEGMNTRWGDKVYNKQLGRFTEGRYKAYSKQGIQGSINFMLKSILNMMTLGYGVSDEKLRGDIKDDMTFANMRKNMAELKFYGAALLASLLFNALAKGEDDEEVEQIYRLMANTFFRLEQDAEFYSNPRTAMEVLRNPAPIIKTLTDMSLAAYATADYIRDAEGYEKSKRDPLSKKWMKTIPFGNSIRSIEYLSKTDLDK